MRWRIAVSAAIGLASGAFCWFLMRRFNQDAADFRWALHIARRLIARQNPYDTPLEQYPVTAAVFASLVADITGSSSFLPILTGRECSRCNGLPSSLPAHSFRFCCQ